MYEWFLMLALGFVTFFATGIDDTLVYAGSYLHNKKKNHKKLITLGILAGTLIALVIAVFAGSIMKAIPFKHLIGGGVLVLLGLVTFIHKPGIWRKNKIKFFKAEKHIKKVRSADIKNVKFFGLGIVLFFSTGLDDLIAYSNLILAKGSWLPICLGVIIATLVSLIIAYFLTNRLKKFPHPERIGGAIIIIIGVLLALQIL